MTQNDYFVRTVPVCHHVQNSSVMDPNAANTRNLKRVICSGKYTDVSHWICHKYCFIDSPANIYY
jgi:hypothetical protein